jgi:hypothetical protein
VTLWVPHVNKEAGNSVCRGCRHLGKKDGASSFSIFFAIFLGLIAVKIMSPTRRRSKLLCCKRVSCRAECKLHLIIFKFFLGVPSFLSSFTSITNLCQTNSEFTRIYFFLSKYESLNYLYFNGS